jgi:hypothetical protein
MTQASKLKKTIRARARKTGESYTAARRMVLKQRAKAAPEPTPRPAPRAPATTLSATLAKREPRLVERTGHGWEHWFAVLDRFGAREKGHTAAARHVAEDHGVDGWYAQAITVEYERARGLRAANQRMSGEYEVSVSKLLPAGVGAVVKALRDSRARARWMGALDPELSRAFDAAVAGAPGLREREQGGARMRFKTASGVTVALYLDPKPKGKSSLVAQNMKLAAASDIDRYRATWKEAFAALGRQLGE